MQDLGDRSASVGIDPGDAGRKAEHVGRDEHPLGSATLVVGLADLRGRVGGHDDGDCRRGTRQRSRVRYPRLGNGTDRQGLAQRDEAPRLLVLARPRPAGRIGDGVHLLRCDRLRRELPGLPHAEERLDCVARSERLCHVTSVDAHDIPCRHEGRRLAESSEAIKARFERAPLTTASCGGCTTTGRVGRPPPGFRRTTASPTAPRCRCRSQASGRGPRS